MTGRSDRPPIATGPPRRIRSALVLVVLAVAAVGCGGDEEPEVTFEQRLTELEGKALTPAEVAERVEIGETLCRLDGAVLNQVWLRLDEDQLDFQDIVFSMLCPDRSIAYAGSTGRYVTEIAEQSGVVTSTTRPTATTVRSSTPARPTTTVDPTVTGADTSDPAGVATSASSSSTASSATSVLTSSPSTSPSTSSSTAPDPTVTSTLVPTTRQTSGTPTR